MYNRMNDYTHKPNLYRWKPQNEDKRVYSRSQKVTTHDDIQDWLQKVEAASDNATAEVLGLNNNAGGRLQRKHVAKATAEYAKQNEEAYSEAQDLLSEWMNEKVDISYDMDDDIYDDYLQKREVQSKVKQEWDHLSQLNYEDIERELLSKQGIKSKSNDPYDQIANMSEEKAVATIINTMLDKEVVKKDFIADLGFNEKTQKDPRLKMDLRRQQVKENREKREQELEDRRRAIQQKKDAHAKAKQIVLNEEREKHSKAKKQEMDIKKEMAKIRKEMQEEKRKREEEIQSKREEKEKLQRLAQEEFDRQKEVENREEMIRHQKAGEKKKMFMMKLEKLQSRQAVNHLKILQRHFAAWYHIVLERRLKMGKARAMSDWKLLLRAFNAWKCYVRNNTVNRETREHEMDIIASHRNTQAAEKHYRNALLQKYFSMWQLWVRQEQERKELEINQNQTRQKMMSLLSAAASGKLLDGKEDGVEQKPSVENLNLSGGQNDIDLFFNQKQKVNCKFNMNTARSEISTLSETERSNKPPPPKEAWQVTKRHLNLTKEEIANLGDGETSDIGSQSDRKIRARFGTQPWMNRHYVANSYENRHTAQKQILKQQQEQLKEQQRLIEELKFQQQTFMFNEQLEEQKLLQKQLNNNMKNLKTMQLDKDEKMADNVNVWQDGASSETSSRTELTLDLNADEKEDHQASSRSNLQTERTQVSTTANTTARSGYSSNSKYVQALKNMEDRAAERARLKAEREAKRKMAEEERLVQLQAEEEERKQRDIEEKKARIEAHKEKKRLEKQREIDKLEFIERMKRLNSMADAHYQRSLLKYRGLLRFKKMVTISKNNESRSEQHYEHCLLRKVLLSWHREVKSEVEDKERLAEQMHCFLLRKRTFHNWQKYKFHMAIEEEKAKRHYARNLLSKIIQVWADYAIEEKLAYWEKERKAKEFYPIYLKRVCFKAWKKYPEYIRTEQEKEKRRMDMRKKVSNLLPDYEAVRRTRESLDLQ